MKQNKFIDAGVTVAAMPEKPGEKAVLSVNGAMQEEPKRKIASWNYGPFFETYFIPAKVNGAA
jgi:hypothetical protein